MIKPLILIAILNIIFRVVGETPTHPKDSNFSSNEGKKLEVLFDEIMKSMPEETKVKVEAAKEQCKKGENKSGNVSEKVSSLPQNSTAPLKELPPEIREKVENLINQMDRRMEERKARMREINQKGQR